MTWNKEPGSFRDPSGFVFSQDGVLYRQVNLPFAHYYRQLIDSGLHAELVRDGLIVAHEEVPLRLTGAPPAHAVIRPVRIPFISYPYEWCFSQLKAAALLTLEIQRRALEHDLMLRDASAYNIQFHDGRPIFIDTLSFGPHTADRPWPAYRQFCQHFLGPLALMALVDPSMGQLSRIHLDGIPLALTSRLLPLTSRLRPGLLVHAYLHGRQSIAGEQQHSGAPSAPPRSTMGKTAMLGLVDSLRRTVQGLAWTPGRTLWSTYTGHSNYTVAAQEQKQRLVADLLDVVSAQSPIRTVWDLGANTGAYSEIAAKRAGLVVSFDMDHASVEHHVQACSARGERKILPLIQDLANPSPATGWNNEERRSLEQRGPADVALALALVHHLVIGNNVPLDRVADFFRRVCRHLIIEFIPKEDSQVTRMLALREDVFTDYSQAQFEEAFAHTFDVLRVIAIEGTLRTIYLMQRR